MTRKSQLCFSVFVGAANRIGRGRFSSRRENILRDVTQKYFPQGATILNAKGTWLNPDTREFADEEARQVLVCAPSRAALRPWCEALMAALNQKELLVVQLGSATRFVAKKHHSRRVSQKTPASGSRGHSR